MEIKTRNLVCMGIVGLLLHTAAFGVSTWSLFKQLGAGERVQAFDQDDSLLWVGTNKALYTASASGLSWRQLKLGNVHAIDIEDPFSCVGIDSSLVVYSRSRQIVNTYSLTRNAGTINSIITYSDSDIVVGTNTGVYERYTLKGGAARWDTLLSGEVVNSVKGIDDKLIVGCESGLFETAFTDTDWTELSTLPARSVAPSDSGFFVLADSSFWYYAVKSLTNGYRFDSIPPAPLTRGSISTFTLSWKTKFCAIKSKGVYWSVSNQNKLFPLDTGHLPDKNITALYSLDLSVSTLFAATSSGVLYTIPIDSLNDLGNPIIDRPDYYSSSRGLKNKSWLRPYWVHENLVVPIYWPASEPIAVTIVDAKGKKLTQANITVARGFQTITFSTLSLSKGTLCIKVSGRHGVNCRSFLVR